MKTKLCLGVAILAVAFGVQAGEETATSEISGEIVGSCTFTVGSHDFGAVNASEAGTTKTSNVPFSVNCSNGVVYKIGMNSTVPMEYTPTWPGAPVGALSSSLLMASNKLALEQNGSPIGELSFWWNTERTAALELDTPTQLRTGTGANQSLAVMVDWKLPESSAFGSDSFGKWKVVNTYKVIF